MKRISSIESGLNAVGLTNKVDEKSILYHTENILWKVTLNSEVVRLIGLIVGDMVKGYGIDAWIENNELVLRKYDFIEYDTKTKKTIKMDYVSLNDVKDTMLKLMQDNGFEIKKVIDGIDLLKRWTKIYELERKI